MVFYESPHRLVKALEQFLELFGTERQASVSRELTKLFEETQRGTLPELLAYFGAKTIKGEIVIVVEGSPYMGKAARRDRTLLATEEMEEEDDA